MLIDMGTNNDVKCLIIERHDHGITQKKALIDLLFFLLGIAHGFFIYIEANKYSEMWG